MGLERRMMSFLGDRFTAVLSSNRVPEHEAGKGKLVQAGRVLK